MEEYHKIQSIFRRDPETRYKTFLEGQYTLPEFEYLADNMWDCTEKVDGTNIRVDFLEGRMRIGGRTDQAQIPAPLVEKLHELFTPLIFALEGLCLYGEGYGAKIQKGGGLYSSHQDFVLFDVKAGEWWLGRSDVEDVASLNGIRVVPIIKTCTLLEMVEDAKNGFQSTWGDFTAEGYVARPTIELKTRSGHRIITKVKCKDFPN